MITHSYQFKEKIKNNGRQIDNKITYGTNQIPNNKLFNITRVVNSNILKSVMKELDFESTIKIPVKTEVNYKIGLKIDEEYEYIDGGNYIIYSNEYNEDTKSYQHVCYDKMLNSMKEYKELQNGTFPMTIKEYLNNICLDIGLTFKNMDDTFANYNKVISSDIYANLEYTYRDILDELAQVTASTICISQDDKVEIRYLNETNDTINERYFKDTNVKFGEKYGPINSIVLSRSAESDNVYLQDETSIEQNGLCELKIVDNQIMNFNDRSDYLSNILEKLNGVTYYINDYISTGILYYESCDKYNVQIGEHIYDCVLFNSEQKISQGVQETIYTELPKENKTDYKKADKTDRRINQAFIIVDKQKQTITELVSNVTDTTKKVTEAVQTVDGMKSTVSNIETNLNTQNDDINIIKQQQTQLSQTSTELKATITDIQNNGVQTVKNTMVTVDIEGVKVSVDTDNFSSLMNNKGIFLYRYGNEIGKFTPDLTELDNITVRNYLVTGYHRIEKYTNEKGQKRTGFFWVGDR